MQLTDLVATPISALITEETLKNLSLLLAVILRKVLCIVMVDILEYQMLT